MNFNEFIGDMFEKIATISRWQKAVEILMEIEAKMPRLKMIAAANKDGGAVMLVRDQHGQKFSIEVLEIKEESEGNGEDKEVKL